MPKLGDVVMYVTNQGQPRLAFVSAEVIELPKKEDEPEEEKQVRERHETEERERAEKEHKRREELLQADREAAKAAHEEAEARAGGPIQRVALVPPESPSPMPLVPPMEVEQEDEPTGPELTLHVLLHVGDVEFARHGSMAICEGVKHSDKNLPNTWHEGE